MTECEDIVLDDGRIVLYKKECLNCEHLLVDDNEDKYGIKEMWCFKNRNGDVSE